LSSAFEQFQLPSPGPKYSHHAFRYPAKFHPPVVAGLLERYAPANAQVLDNFCGSGTTLVEAAVSKRPSFGIDIDPVAVLVSQAKTRKYDRSAVESSARHLLAALAAMERTPAEYDHLMFNDINEELMRDTIAADALWVPAIPRLSHWFRAYVTIDLARIYAAIRDADMSEENRLLFFLAFASAIRTVSNADPVPVSGLEVTAHMRKKDLDGRRINPFDVYRKRLAKTVEAVLSFSEVVRDLDLPTVIQGDATKLPSGMPKDFDVVVTSPPYHNAVDYYRRHQLEMYWLGLIKDHAERLDLLPQYIGRHRIPAKHLAIQGSWEPMPVASSWYERMNEVDSARATDFRHYIVSMQQVFREVRGVLKSGSPLVMVVGDSQWRGALLPTARMLEEVAGPFFSLEEQLWYPIKNRYMSYSRHNGASIAREEVLVFR
jgi:DNA modification methylase